MLLKPGRITIAWTCVKSFRNKLRMLQFPIFEQVALFPTVRSHPCIIRSLHGVFSQQGRHNSLAWILIKQWFCTSLELYKTKTLQPYSWKNGVVSSFIALQAETLHVAWTTQGQNVPNPTWKWLHRPLVSLIFSAVTFRDAQTPQTQGVRTLVTILELFASFVDLQEEILHVAWASQSHDVPTTRISGIVR